MARDPLDTAILVMADQARAVAEQLDRVDAARAALVAIREDPEALAASVRAARDAAVAARVERELAVAGVTTVKRRMAAGVRGSADWLSGLGRALLAAEAVDRLEVQVACAQVRAVMVGERRRFPGLLAGMHKLVPVLELQFAVLSGISLFDVVIPAGRQHLSVMTALADDLTVATTARRQASARERLLRTALLRALREVRRAWTSAVATGAGVPELDLRVVKGNVPRSRKRRDQGQEASQSAMEVRQGAEDGVAVALG